MSPIIAKQRKQAVAAALASVRAEGLTPSNAVKKRLEQYIQGTMTANQVQRETLSSATSKNKRRTS